MAVETITLISLAGHAAVLLSRALPDGAQVDGSAVEVAKCFPAFLKTTPPLQAHYEQRIKSLEASLTGSAVNIDELKAVARDVLTGANAAKLHELVKGQELVAKDICQAICSQEQASGIIKDASAHIDVPLKQLVTGLAQTWIDAPETRNALWVESFNAIIRTEQTGEDTNARVRRIEEFLKAQSSAATAQIEQSGLTDAQLLKLVQAFEEANQPQENWFDLLLEKAALLQDLQARLAGISNDDPEVDTLRRQAEQAIEAAEFVEAEALLERAEAIDAEACEKLLADMDEKQQTLNHRTESQARSAFARGELAEARLRYTEAYGHYHRAYELTPEDNERLVKAAKFAWLGGDYAESERLNAKHMAMLKEQHGPESHEVAYTLNNIAVQYWHQGKHAEAEPLYLRAIDIGEKTLGPDHPDLAARLNNLAGLYMAQGKYDEAEPLYLRVMSMDEKTLGSEHPEAAKTLNNLAELYRAQGKFDEAEPLFLRDLAISEKALGRNHPDVATTLNNLAGLYEAQGKYDGAEPLYMRAIDIGEKTLGPDHSALAKWLNNLAVLYKVQGKFDEAEPLYERALDISEKTLGPEHPYLATALNNLAGLYKAQGKYDEAEPLYLRAISILESAFPDGHPNLDAVRANYAQLKAKMV